MRITVPSVARLVVAVVLAATIGVVHARAQAPDTREGHIIAAQAEKAGALQPYKPSDAEAFVTMVEEKFLGGGIKWHPFFDSAYAGGGFTVGAGYLTHVGAYSSFDARGSITFSAYKRFEAEYIAPRLFKRRGQLNVLGGWREATQVGFYGIGTGNTSKNDRANYTFQQPYLSATLTVRPTRGAFLLSGAEEISQWKQLSGSGSAPSVEEVYTPDELPGLGASPTYFHTSGTAAFDWRDAPLYSKRGGYYGVTLHSYADPDDAYGFRQVDYLAIQHVPVLRDTWVLSLRGRVQTTFIDGDSQVPFFMLPALGGGSSLRGFASWRFRDRNSLLLSADWRVLANHFFDLALFYDGGKVAARPADLDLDHLKSDYGVGLRFHGPTATPLRVDFAKSNEGLQMVFSSSAAF